MREHVCVLGEPVLDEADTVSPGRVQLRWWLADRNVSPDRSNPHLVDTSGV